MVDSVPFLLSWCCYPITLWCPLCLITHLKAHLFGFLTGKSLKHSKSTVPLPVCQIRRDPAHHPALLTDLSTLPDPLPAHPCLLCSPSEPLLGYHRCCPVRVDPQGIGRAWHRLPTLSGSWTVFNKLCANFLFSWSPRSLL